METERTFLRTQMLHIRYVACGFAHCPIHKQWKWHHLTLSQVCLENHTSGKEHYLCYIWIVTVCVFKMWMPLLGCAPTGTHNISLPPSVLGEGNIELNGYQCGIALWTSQMGLLFISIMNRECLKPLHMQTASWIHRSSEMEWYNWKQMIRCLCTLKLSRELFF